jgi:succinylarginine dihydrolase
MTDRAYEVNFDGLVGPTHNYAGLSRGNIASQLHKHEISNPKAAALQGLAKMKLLADLGLKQAVLPPQQRPDLGFLRQLGFTGSDVQVIEHAHRDDPQLLAAAYSASSMWAANAATVSPSADCADGRVHITPANLISQLHRAIEAPTTTALLRDLFPHGPFVVHEPLPSAMHLRDEGAANHTRLCRAYGESGLQLFTFGCDDDLAPANLPADYPPRQTRRASQAIARRHHLSPKRTFFAQQHPLAIDAGVFHNDVIAVGDRDLLILHAQAFTHTANGVDALSAAFARHCGGELHVLMVHPRQLPLAEAVQTYLFNSQLLQLPNGRAMLLCPEECRQSPRVTELLDDWLTGPSPISRVQFIDIRQSMHNGGGPACLRLRVVLTEAELAAMHQPVLLTDALYDQLVACVQQHYRDRLSPDDLADPHLLTESLDALDALTKILHLPALYPFQHD